MNNQNACLRFLQLLSQAEFSKRLYLEGGAALSFVYGLKRVFSGDLDFTLEHQRHRSELWQAVKHITEKIFPNQDCRCELRTHKIVIKNKKTILLELDFYILRPDLFEWETTKLSYRHKSFPIRVHSLKDIFAEKISNILQSDRCEFKDIVDIIKIWPLLEKQLDLKTFTKYLKNKLKGKKIVCPGAEPLISLYLAKKSAFKASYRKYPRQSAYTFESKFAACRNILTKYL